VRIRGNSKDKESTMTTPQLLSECARLLNQFGPDSPQIDKFAEDHREDSEFLALLATSKRLKARLTCNNGRDFKHVSVE
jgi:hypothetical protein